VMEVKVWWRRRSMCSGDGGQGVVETEVDV